MSLEGGSGPPPEIVTADLGLTARGMPRQWRWLLPAAVCASTAAWLAAVTSGQADGALRVTLMVLGAVFTGTAAGLPLWVQARTARSRADAVESARAARASMRIAIEDSLEPFTNLLLQLSATHGAEHTRLRGEATQLALTSIAQLSVANGPEQSTSPRRVRACLYLHEVGPPSRLVPQSFVGRSGAPTVVFDMASRPGQLMHRIMTEGWIVVDDTEQQRVVPWWDEEHRYRTYAAGPVIGAEGAIPIGVLTIDALEPGALAGLDIPLMRLIAHLLSLALHI